MNEAAAQRHPIIELLARYKAVFKAAWEVRHELAGPKRLADEAAFLPAALSLQETPVHPAPRRAMWIILALFAIALAWSILGQVDVVAVAHGRIVVADNTKLIQPLETAVVKAIKVRDGDRVTQGQVLVELDATGAGADRRSVQEQLEAARSEFQRSEALLTALNTGKPPRPNGSAPTQALLRAEWADIQAKLAKL
ncbi:MAG: biotin/lipoyl-binding protein [Pseudomonadota bacterium]